MHKKLDIYINIVYQTNKTTPCSKSEISEKLRHTRLCVKKKKNEDFLL